MGNTELLEGTNECPSKALDIPPRTEKCFRNVTLTSVSELLTSALDAPLAGDKCRVALEGTKRG